MAPADDLVRLDTHLLVNVLYGLCRAARPDPAAAARAAQRAHESAVCAGASPREADATADTVHPPLAFEAAPGRPGSVRVRFAGRHGGTGAIVIGDDPALRSTLCWLAGHRDGEPYLRAVLAAVRSQENVDGPWHHERAVELLWGPRNQKHSRARQAPPVRRLVELLLQAQVELDAPVSETPASTTKNRRKARDEERARARSAYGGSFAGAVLVTEADTGAVRLHPQLRQQLDAGPYDMRPRQVFRLRIEGHHNPKGNQPSRAVRCATRHGILDYARFRRQAALQHGGAVQAITIEDLLTRFTSVDVDPIRRARRMPSLVDAIEADLNAGALGDVALEQPIAGQRHRGRCELRLKISCDDRDPGRAAIGQTGGGSTRRHDRDRDRDRRPGAAATASGRAASTGPPP